MLATRSCRWLFRTAHLAPCRSMSSKPSIANIKKIRKTTGLPLTLVRQALIEGSNDVDSAMEWLKNNEDARAELAKSKRGMNEINEGQIAVCSTGSRGAMVQVNCETDFVARNEKFAELVNGIANSVAQSTHSVPFTVQHLPTEEVLAMSFDEAHTVAAKIDTTLSALGENISFSKAAVADASDGCVGTYVHDGGSYGAIVCARTTPVVEEHTEDLVSLCNKVAQHIVAMNPSRPSEGNDEGSLLDQAYVLSPGSSVGDILQAEGKRLGTNIEIVDFERWER